MESCAAVLRRKMPCRSFGIVWERETKPRKMRAAGMQTADDQKSASVPFPGTEALSLCGTTRVDGKDPVRSLRRIDCLCRRGGFPVTGGSSVGNYWGLPARSLPPSRVHSAYRCRPVSSSSGSLCGSFGARTYTRSAVFSMLSIVYRQGSLVKLRLRIGSAADCRITIHIGQSNKKG